MNIGSLNLRSGRTMVVAEIGVNHDGSVHRALDLVDVAKRVGADAIKLQVFDAHQLMHPTCKFAEYQETRTEQDDPVAMLQQYSLTDAELARVAAYARRIGLMTIATPFSPTDVARVVAIGTDAIKVASPDLVNTPLLRTAAAAGLPLIISTGASEMSEIAGGVKLLAGHKPGVCLLHCISSYPTQLADAQLNWIGELSRAFGLPTGYSDHTTELVAGALSVTAGACLIEKHLTYDRSAIGPDHSASFDEQQFAAYVAQIRMAEQMRGTGPRRVLACEEDVRSVSRQSLVLNRPLKANDVIHASMLTVQRPGTGVPAVEFDLVIGQRLTCDAAAGTMLMPQMIEKSHAA